MPGARTTVGDARSTSPPSSPAATDHPPPRRHVAGRMGHRRRHRRRPRTGPAERRAHRRGRTRRRRQPHPHRAAGRRAGHRYPAAVPPVPGLREARPWTSRDVTNLHEVPRPGRRIGGGVVACESATWLNGLGATEVTIIERGPRCSVSNEPFAGEHGARVAARPRGQGLLSARGWSASRGPRSTTPARAGCTAARSTVTSSTATTITVDEIVVATGRMPEQRRHRPGDGRRRTPEAVSSRSTTLDRAPASTGEWLYAVGDIIGRALLTHMGKYQARICGEVIAARARAARWTGRSFTRQADHGGVPQVTFTDPEVGVGRADRAEAREAGIEVGTVEYDLAGLAGTSVLPTTTRGAPSSWSTERRHPRRRDVRRPGHRRAGARRDGRGRRPGPIEVLWHAVPSYPTVSEIWLRLLETLSSNAVDRADQHRSTRLRDNLRKPHRQGKE